MSSFDVIGMCVRNLVKRKLRTFLTLLGVMIGTASIILMISLGLATDAQFAQMIEDMGMDLTVINVSPQWQGSAWNPQTGEQEEREQQDLTDESAARISQIPGVQVATPLMRERLLFRSGPYAMDADITGVNIEALKRMGYTVSEGRLLEEGDGIAVVFGATAERHFFDTRSDMWWSERFWMGMPWSGADESLIETFVDVMNDPIRLYYETEHFWRGGRMGGGEDEFGEAIEDAFRPVRSFELNVVGVLENQGNQWDPWADGVIYMDINLLQELTQEGRIANIRAREEDEWNPHFSAVRSVPRATYQQLFVRVYDMDYTRDVAIAIWDMGYNAWYQGSWIDQQRRQQQAIQTLLALIAAVSLFVAAINIANTMITSVTERTREIGIMKVIGASLADVRRLFLTEAAVIGMLGGMFGIGLALFGSYALNNFDIEFLSRMNMAPPIRTEGTANAAMSLITPWLLGVALAVASGIGTLSGIFPAIHATRLSALAAIRNE